MPLQSSAGRHPARRVADYIAGMTDRFALQEHFRLTGRSLAGFPQASAGA